MNQEPQVIIFHGKDDKSIPEYQRTVLIKNNDVFLPADIFGILEGTALLNSNYDGEEYYFYSSHIFLKTSYLIKTYPHLAKSKYIEILEDRLRKDGDIT